MAATTEKRDTIVIGAGQSGLSMSYLLTQEGRDHLLLERAHTIGASWRRRWDSFTLVTPNWLLQLPGYPYEGDDPDGFLARDEVVAYLEEYASRFDPPVRFGVTVTSVEEIPEGEGYLVRTSDGLYEAANVVVAPGTFQFPKIPAHSDNAPAAITQIHTSDYRNPAQLPSGGVMVVGSGQSGCQIAQELHESGRSTYLCVGKAGRLPRRYRGRDGIWWAFNLGMADRTVDDLDSPRERFQANPQISGRDGGRDISLHQFAQDGIVLLGRLQDIQTGRAVLAPDLRDNLAATDTMVAEFRKGVDQYVAQTGLDAPEEAVDEPRDGFDQEIITTLDLNETGISTIIWATGYRWDFRWIDLPIFDEFGYPTQSRGVTAYSGLYFLGLHWLHTLKSGLFFGVGGDAAHIAQHIATR